MRAVTADKRRAQHGSIAADTVLVTTDAAPPPWFEDTGLARDDGGFLAVGPTLQVRNDPDVFAAGDCAGLADPRPKAGVFAVRAGPPLPDNLRRRALGAPLRDWQPQNAHLALISTGERYAVASRGVLKAEGAWLWTVKDWIDRRWMRMYRDSDHRLPDGAQAGRAVARGRTGDALRRMRRRQGRAGPAVARARTACAGAFRRRGRRPRRAGRCRRVRGRATSTWCRRSIFSAPSSMTRMSSARSPRTMRSMTCSRWRPPRYALATAVVPPGQGRQVEETLFQLLAGARACLDREGVALIGGHSGEGELALGLAVTGEIARRLCHRRAGSGRVTRWSSPAARHRRVVRGEMRARANAAWIEAALAAMRQSNRPQPRSCATTAPSAMTDVTGFGLIGHLGEMLAASLAGAELDPAAVPLYPGALELAQAGISSTLLPENLSLASLLRGTVDAPLRTLLFDPQTSGGLLAGVPADRAAACVAALREVYPQTATIGRVTGPVRTASDVAIAIGMSKTAVDQREGL